MMPATNLVGGITTAAGAEIAMATRDKTVESPDRRTVERLATWVAGPISRTKLRDAYHLLGAADHLGFDRLLAEHREAWAQRWSDAEVTIEGDPESGAGRPLGGVPPTQCGGRR